MNDLENTLLTLKDFLQKNLKADDQYGLLSIYVDNNVTSIGTKAWSVDFDGSKNEIEEGIPGFMILMAIKKFKKLADEENPVKWNMLNYSLDMNGTAQYETYWDQEEEDRRTASVVVDDEESRLDAEVKTTMGNDAIALVRNVPDSTDLWFSVQNSYQGIRTVFEALCNRGLEVERSDLRRIDFESQAWMEFSDRLKSLSEDYSDFRFSLNEGLWNAAKREYYAYVFDFYYDGKIIRVEIHI